MKKISLFILSLVVLSSCSSDDSSESILNTAPEAPSLNYPSNNLICIGNSINFVWNPSTDAEGDEIKYDLQVATDNSFNDIAYVLYNTTATSWRVPLDKGEMYYWRVRATDRDRGAGTFSEVFNFYTEGEGDPNSLPFAPQLNSPGLHSVVTEDSVTLDWTAEDADDDDLVYDVYFGTSASTLEKVASDISQNEFSVDLTTDGRYYWRVIVKDEKGEVTIGQLWDFTKS